MSYDMLICGGKVCDGSGWQPSGRPSPSTHTTVIVNGAAVVEDAAQTGALPGKVLRSRTDGGVY
jgi:hypothetical protein